MIEGIGLSEGVDFGITDGMTIGVGVVPEAGFNVLTYNYSWGISDSLELHIDGYYIVPTSATEGFAGLYYGLGDAFKVYLGGGVVYEIAIGYGIVATWYLEAEAQVKAGDNFLLYGDVLVIDDFDNFGFCVGAGFTF